jgi:hypothetical protein
MAMLLRVLQVALVALLGTTASAQEFRSTLSGRVTDPSGAAIPNAKVIATSAETNAKSEITTGSEGEFSLPFLAPGGYTLSVEAQGFKKYVQSGITLGTNVRVAQDVVMQLGSQGESVTVTADVALLSTATASVGQVITSAQIENMPMNGRTPLTLAQLAYGVTPASDPRFTRPFDNAGPSGFSMGGGQSQSNELLLDGAPDMTRNRRVAFNPPVDAVAEVKVEAFQPDAAYGNTAGGTVNVVMKGGTNEFHGSLYEFNQVSALKATPFFTNAAGQRKPVTRFNQYGGSIGGPILIPKVLDGRNKLFFFFTYEGIKQSEPEPTFSTVPTDLQKTGNFTALGAQGVTIYDPNTGVLNNGVISRSAFPGNIIPPNRISPVARNILNFIPGPNDVGNAFGQNNRFDNAVRKDNFSSYIGRFDWNISDRHKLFFNMRQNDRVENRGNRYGNIVTGNNLSRVNWGALLDDVYTITPTFLMNTRFNWNRFVEGNVRESDGFNFTTLGFPQYMAASSTRNVFPRIDFPDNMFSDFGDNGGDSTPFDTYQFFQTFTKIAGNHSLKFGADLRKQIESSNGFGNSSGLFTFAPDWTRAASNAANARIGQDLAALMLGLPTAGNFQVNASRTNQAYYYAFFVQDDWRVRKNLTLNLGLRYEAETGTTERFNRTVAGFDPSAPLSITTAAEAAYAAAPVPLLPASQFRARGGVFFAQPGKETIYEPYQYGFAPRFGVSWQPTWAKGLVVRGGVGLYLGTWGTAGIQQPGFSAQTPLVAGVGGVFLTPNATLTNPFPDGIQQPVGNLLGVNTFLGQNVRYVSRNLATPHTWRWNFNIQKSVGKDSVLELGYMGSDATRIPENDALQANPVPNEFLSTSPTRDQARITLLSNQTANPFRGLLPGTGLNGNTTNVENLLRPYPQFSGNGGVTIENPPNGYSKFHQLQTRYEKRFSAGLQFLANYQWSKLTEATRRLNWGDSQLAYRIGNEDRPHRFVFSGSYDLPFGKGKAFAGGVGPWTNRLVGGWQLNTIYSIQAGGPVEFGNVIYYGGDLKWNARNLNQAFDITRFERAPAQQLDRNVRTFPQAYSAYRADKINNIDISVIKNIPIVERLTAQLRVESFNAFNHTIFNGPDTGATSGNFGRITSASNLPRTYQLALRLRF